MRKNYIAERVHRAHSGEDSPFMQLLALAAQYDHIVALGRGDPDLPTPPHIIQAAVTALENGCTKYTAPTGLFALRKAVADKLQREHGLTYDPESELIITAGTQEAIFLSMHALVDPGDEVIVPEPYYACYAESAKMAGAKLVPVQTRIADNFEVDADRIRAKVTPKTKLIALLSPSNPSGAVVPGETMLAIAKIAQENDLLVLSDELYERIMYDGKKHTCFAAMPDMRERTIVLNGVSKAYAMTGMRVGFMAGPKRLIRPMSGPHHAMVICANTVSQYAALAALTGPQGFLADYREQYDRRRRIVMDGLDAGGIPYARPSGGFFVFADIRKSGVGSMAFCEGLLRAAQVQVFPGTMYGEGMDGYIRISFLAEEGDLRKAVQDLTAYYHSLWNETGGMHVDSFKGRNDH